ncbi:MAG: hypothetical protein K2X29_12530 [Candidatus Obscuribacterales bacterium]|nr:hypothetical protein [Candidatus Obscuribacterales bacterium]
MSRFHLLGDDEILDALRIDSPLSRSYQFDKETKFAVIRIFVTSEYHNKEGIDRIRQAFGSHAQSIRFFEFENDWYAYIFFQYPTCTEALKQRITNLLHLSGIDSGCLEVSGDGSYIPLPLQQGFAWLNSNGHPIVRREEISLKGALELFISDFRKYALTPESLVGLELEFDVATNANDSSLPSDGVSSLPVTQIDGPILKQSYRREETANGSSSQLLLPIFQDKNCSESVLLRKRPSRDPPLNIRNYVSRRAPPSTFGKVG